MELGQGRTAFDKPWPGRAFAQRRGGPPAPGQWVRPSALGPGTLGRMEVSDENVRLQSVLNRRRGSLCSAKTSGVVKPWLTSKLNSAEGTGQVFTLLQEQVERADYIDRLEEAKRDSPGAAALEPAFRDVDVLQPAWWSPPPEAVACEGFTQVQPDPGWDDALDSYVFVEKRDVVEAIGSFVADYISSLPEAQNMQPVQLQKALKAAFQELRKGRIRRLWDCGRMVYRVTAFSYGAFSVYENPWIIRAILAAVWTASRILVGAIL